MYGKGNALTGSKRRGANRNSGGRGCKGRRKQDSRWQVKKMEFLVFLPVFFKAEPFDHQNQNNLGHLLK